MFAVDIGDPLIELAVACSAFPLRQMGTDIGERTVHVHSPRYDFNGDALAIVASY